MLGDLEGANFNHEPKVNVLQCEAASNHLFTSHGSRGMRHLSDSHSSLHKTLLVLSHQRSDEC